MSIGVYRSGWQSHRRQYQCLDSERPPEHNVLGQVVCRKVLVAMNIIAQHGNHLQTEASVSNMLMPDITSDATPGLEELAVAGVMPEELTVSQTAKILGIQEERVTRLIADQTLCCVKTDEGGAPLLDAACVRAQAGKSKAVFLDEVRRIVGAESRARFVEETTQSPLEQLFAGLSELSAGDENASMMRLGAANDPVSAAVNVTPMHLKPLDRRAITARNVEAILSNLESANGRLEAAMYRAGYLESKVEGLEEKLKDLPELRTKAARSLIFERENAHLKATLAKHELELIEVHQTLDRLRQSWWWQAWSWVFGVRI